MLQNCALMPTFEEAFCGDNSYSGFSHRYNLFTMGKDKKTLDDLKDDLKTINKNDQEKVRGGSSDKDKDKEKNKWNSGLGGIVPQ